MFLDFLYKRKCISCNRIENKLVCSSCINLIEDIKNRCNKCGFILNENICNHCSTNNIYFEKLIDIGIYSGLLKTLIYEYKYNKNKNLSKFFSEIINLKINNIKDKIDIITSIPMHKEKLKDRGFNQAELFAKEISYKTGWKYLEILDRTKKTKAQFSLNLEQRKENLKDAFSIKNRNLENKNIIIVDDIYTTGTTIREACLKLKEKRINNIYIVVIARAIE